MSWGQHPDRNTTNTPFADSAVGKKWKEQGKDVLPYNITLDGSAFSSVPIWAAKLSEEEYKAKLKEKTSKKREKRKFEEALGAVTTAANSATLPCQITLPGHVIDTRFFLDSGAVSGNYVSEDIAKRLREAGAKEYPQEGKRVCMAIGSVCRPCGNVFEFPLRFFNESINDHESIDIKASVFDTQWPIMIGLPSIRTHRLTQKLMSHFVSEAKAPQGKHMSKRQAPEVSQVSTRDADDATVTTSPSAAPLADMTQRPCDFPLAPILAHRHTPYAAHHYCGCLTASVDTVGMCQTCDETLAAITPTSTDTDDEDDYIADDDISYERQDALANALEAPIPPPQAEHVNAMTDA
jgi:hypothetical protein